MPIRSNSRSGSPRDSGFHGDLDVLQSFVVVPADSAISWCTLTVCSTTKLRLVLTVVTAPLPPTLRHEDGVHRSGD